MIRSVFFGQNNSVPWEEEHGMAKMLTPPQTWRLYHRLQIFAENHEHFYMMEIMMGCSQAESIIISARWLGRYFSDRRIITDLNPYTWRLQKIIMVNGLFALKTIIFDAELNCFSVEGKLQHSRVKKNFLIVFENPWQFFPSFLTFRFWKCTEKTSNGSL